MECHQEAGKGTEEEVKKWLRLLLSRGILFEIPETSKTILLHKKSPPVNFDMLPVK